MPVTLASLTRHSALRLRALAGEDRLETPVRWAHVSELTDPVPYMEGGELLLTTAMKLDAEDPEAMRRYVRRLVGARVVGLGFALGVNYDEVPGPLVAAAREEGLPLLAVPRRTPFIAISKAVSAANAADQYRAVTAGFEAQRELTRAALGAEGPAALLAKLASHLDGWVALYDASGAVTVAAPEWAARRAARLTADAERLLARPAPASVVVGAEGEGAEEEDPEGEGLATEGLVTEGAEAEGAGAGGGRDDAEAADRVELQSLGSGRRAHGVLAFGTDAPLGTVERYAVHSAVALLTLMTERSRALRGAERRLGAAVLRMLLAGEPEHARAVAGELYGALLDAPFRVLVVEGEGPCGHEEPSGCAPTALTEALEAAAARSGETLLVVPDGTRLVVLAPDGGAAVAACAAYAEERRATAVRSREGRAAEPREETAVGMSAPAGPVTASGALRQAEQALSVARRRGRVLVEHEQVSAGSVLPLLADDAVRAFAEGMLRGLREHDATGRGDLVASLRAWLSHHGQWDTAAKELGVHRHTLRYRMRRVEEILGRSLEDPDVRMELWLALKAAAPGPRRR